jgi:ATP phosphoribosyltransferase regulatory subunit
MIARGNLSSGLWAEGASLRRRQESLLLGLWENRGYREVAPPLLLPEGLPASGWPDPLRERAAVLRDETGGTLRLRADFTLAVSFMVAARRPSGRDPIRLSYAGPVVRRPAPDLEEGWEIYQAGIERISPAEEREGDGEVLELAAASLSDLGLSDAVLELGHWGVAGPLLQRLPWPEEGRRALEGALNRKSLRSLEELEGRHGASEESALLKELLHVGGRPGTVEALEPRLREGGVWEPWEELRRLEALLRKKFPGLSVRLDPVDVRRWSTYTGLTFKAFTPRHPFAVLSGGRYDGLYPSLGLSLGAVGFALRLPL